MNLLSDSFELGMEDNQSGAYWVYVLVPSDTPLACLECRTYLWAPILQLSDHTTLSLASPSYAFLPNAVRPFPTFFGPLALHWPVPTVRFCRARPDPTLRWSTTQHMHRPVPPMHVFKDRPDPPYVVRTTLHKRKAHYSRVHSTLVPSVACQTTEGEYLLLTIFPTYWYLVVTLQHQENTHLP